MKPGDVLLLENVRFHAGEENNDPAFAEALAANGDLYVNDAFSAAHRAHASTEGLAHLLPAYAGEQMRPELDALRPALGHPQRPVLGIVGGSKVSAKLDLLRQPGDQARQARHRRRHGQHLPRTPRATPSAPRSARRTWPTPRARSCSRPGQANCELFLPVDVVVAAEFKAATRRRGSWRVDAVGDRRA